MELQIQPNMVNIMGLTISESVVIFFVASVVVIIAAILIRYFIISRFKEADEKPGRVQLLLEWAVEAVQNFSKGILGENAHFMSSYVFCIGLFILLVGWIDLFGLRTPLSDLNVTAGLAIITFVMINFFALRKKGLGGRMRSLATPNALFAPLRMLSDVAVPVSLACRMYGNLLGCTIVLELLRSVLLSLFKNYWCAVVPVALAGAMPGILSIYFTLFDVAIQAYVFMTLSVTFVNEAIE